MALILIRWPVASVWFVIKAKKLGLPKRMCRLENAFKIPYGIPLWLSFKAVMAVWYANGLGKQTSKVVLNDWNLGCQLITRIFWPLWCGGAKKANPNSCYIKVVS